MAYCDFCKCADCQNGADYLTHAQTADGRWICSTCYTYEVCLDAQRAEGKALDPCRLNDPNCTHRPKLVNKFEK